MVPNAAGRHSWYKVFSHYTDCVVLESKNVWLQDSLGKVYLGPLKHSFSWLGCRGFKSVHGKARECQRNVQKSQGVLGGRKGPYELL